MYGCTDPNHIALYCGVRSCTVMHCTVLYCTVLYCAVLYCRLKQGLCRLLVLYCTVRSCIVLYCIIMSTVLYCADPRALKPSCIKATVFRTALYCIRTPSQCARHQSARLRRMRELLSKSRRRRKGLTYQRC